MNAFSLLANGFPRFTEADWRAIVVGQSGRAPEDFATRSDGIAVGPIYGRQTGHQAIARRSPGERWRIVERLVAGDANAARRQCGEMIAGGADGVAAVFDTSAHPLPGELPVAAAGDLVRALGEALGEGALAAIDAGEETLALATSFIAVAAEKRWRLTLAFDPIATLAARGSCGRTVDESAAEIVTTAAAMDANAVEGTVGFADGRLWHAGGASEAQELSATLATVVWLMRRFEAGAISADRAVARIAVELAADADQFLTIAKFRAMRLLLGRIFEAAGVAAPAPPIHAETAWRMMSRRDPHTNILRTTTAAFAAAVGGADSITVLPFDAVSGGGNDLGRRLARSTQTILAEEAHVFRVADPGAGSGAVETLTAALAETAWRRFQAIEAAGGIAAALASGTAQDDIAAVRDARMGRARERAMIIVGANAYTEDGEVPDAAPRQRPAARADAGARGEVERLVFARLSEPFEGAGQPT